ncbi:LysM repeat protein [Tenacibaculum sp. 190524A02b]|uniref:LysM repeat protein n=1 Tax=Tenacibaculum vairaonense TaxID=3137860 RepID=A0ABM9PIH4_9FLAO
MRKVFTILFFLLINSFVYAQQDELPDGWDKITLDGEVAYMNLVTGEVAKVKPKNAAKKHVLKKKEFDPTIIHKVDKGETLSKIARKYNLNLAKLYRLNSLTDFDALEVGQEIVVGYRDDNDVMNEQFTKTDHKFHTVNKGDTLFNIAYRYKLTVKKLMTLNNLSKNIIFLGQKLRVK